MIRYRWCVAGIWAALFLVSGYAASGLSDLLTNRFTLPGTDTARADSILEDWQKRSRLRARSKAVA